MSDIHHWLLEKRDERIRQLEAHCAELMKINAELRGTDAKGEETDEGSAAAGTEGHGAPQG